MQSRLQAGAARILCIFIWFRLGKVVRNNYVRFVPRIRIRFYGEQDSRKARQEMNLSTYLKAFECICQEIADHRSHDRHMAGFSDCYRPCVSA